jgi:hypothetical protein
MLKVGVPLHVVQNKASATGLDSSLLEDPEQFISPNGAPPAGMYLLLIYIYYN